MPRGLVAMARGGGHCPLRVSGGILCSERGQSRDAFQAIPLEETSPRCNKWNIDIGNAILAYQYVNLCWQKVQEFKFKYSVLICAFRSTNTEKNILHF